MTAYSDTDRPAGRSHPLPSLTRYAGGTDGVPYAVVLDAGRDGPRAMVSALVHGNEICGAIALDGLLQRGLKPVRGRLAVVFMNVEAYRAEPPRRFLDEDMNRVWDPAVLNGDRSSRELARARQVRCLLEDAEQLLDLHSMQSQDAPVALSGDLDKGAELARAIGVPACIVSDPGHPAGPRMRDYGRFADPQRADAAVLIECGQHLAPAAIDLAEEATLRFLLALDMIDRAQAERLAGRALPPPPRQQLVRVTGLVTAGARFRMADAIVGMQPIARAGTVIGWNDGTPVVTPYDDCVPVMPTPGAAPGTTALRFGRLVD